MGAYFLRKLLQSLLLILGVLVLVFMMVRFTGDPVALMVSREATAEQREQIRVSLGLDQPVPVQFVRYLGGLLRGDLGQSLSLGLPNSLLIGQRIGATFELALASLLLSLAIAVPLGIMAGLRPGSGMDWLGRSVGLAGQTIHSVWLAMILILVFAVQLRWLPSFGRDSWQSLILPTLALSLGSIGQIVQLTRSTVLEVRRENFIRTAHAKGMSGQRVAFGHIAPNVAIPLISVISVGFTYALGGSVYIEQVFAWPGLGSLLSNAIGDNDFPLVQSITIFIALFAISVNLITDLLYGVVDPRVRLGR
ncbi:MAG: ABC transporter permease [Chloroflexota bacterium]|nr:ABC transporter permease [Chloroflexota bacterium]